MKIIVVIDGKKNGPHEPETVKALYHSGKVSEDDLAWREGMTDWQPLRVVCPKLFSESAESSADTPPVSESSETPVQEPLGTEDTPENTISTETSVPEQAPEPDEEEKEAAPTVDVESLPVIEAEPQEKVSDPSEQEPFVTEEAPEETVPTEISVPEQAPEPDEQETTVDQQVVSDKSLEPIQETSTSPPDKLYLGVDGKIHGPLSPDETMAKLLSGEVGNDNLAWKSGMDEWKPLKEVWPDCVNVATTSETHETDTQASLFERLRNELRKK